MRPYNQTKQEQTKMKKCDCHMTDIQKGVNGFSWYQQPRDTYIITGKTVNGARFKIKSDSWPHANGINLFNGQIRIERLFDWTSDICPSQVHRDDHIKSKVIKKVRN
jgi:hypothetical protein